MAIIITFATLSTRWTSERRDETGYLEETRAANMGLWCILFLTYWVTFSHMIPISLYVIIELLKLG